MTNENRCVLRQYCREAGTDLCVDTCPFFVALHGDDGLTGIMARSGVRKEYRLRTLDDPALAEIRADSVVTLPDGQTIRKTDMVLRDELARYVRTFNRHIERGEQIKSMYIYSPNPGNGKTLSASILVNEYTLRHFLVSRSNHRPINVRPAFFLSMHDWHSKYHEFNRPNIDAAVGSVASIEYYEAYRTAKHVPFLVIDDIGASDSSDGFRRDLIDILDHRVSNQMPTVYTSNIPLESLDVGFRGIDRIRDMCIPIEILGDSKRGIRR